MKLYIKVLLIQMPIIELHNDLIKTPPEAGFAGERSESDEVIIGDTLLRKYIPPQVNKLVIIKK